MSSSVLEGLGFALRWLRDRQGRKQYAVANAAGITKGMLSSYETGRQRPSLDTLEKILDTLGSDLNDLHNAIQIVNGRPEGMRRRPEVAPAAGGEAAEGISGVRAVLGVGGNLPPEVEESFVQMLEGFHRFLRYLLERLRHAEA